MKNLSFKLFSIICIISSLADSKENGYAVIESKYFKDLIVKTALDEESKKQGLMGVDKLNEYNGMLFIYDVPKRVNIWMNQTFIPLEIVFIDVSKKIYSIKEGFPNSKSLISSEINVSAILEIPKGCGEKLKINVGDVLDWTFKDFSEIKNIRYFHCLDKNKK